MRHPADEPLHAPYDPHVARRLLEFVRPYRRYVAVAVALLLLLGAAEAARPWLIKLAIDDHIAVGDVAGLWVPVTAFFALLIFDFVAGAFRTYLTTWIGQRAMHDLRERLFDRLQRLPVPFFDRNAIGRLMTRVTSDVEVLNDLFSSGVVAIIGDLVLMVAIAVMMFTMSWQLALVTLLLLPAIATISFFFRQRMRDAHREIRRWVARLNAYLQEHVTGLTVLQLFRREEDSKRDFRRINQDHLRAQVRSVHYYSLFYPLVEVGGAVAIALILWYGGGRILQGAMTFGTLVAFLQYLHKFYSPIRDLAEKYNLLQSAMASGERLVALLDEPVDVESDGTAGLPEARGEIEFDDVWFRYGEESWTLRGVSFRVAPGERVALVGPSTRSSAGGSCWTAWTSGSTRARSSAGGWDWSSRTYSCSPTRSSRTCGCTRMRSGTNACGGRSRRSARSGSSTACRGDSRLRSESAAARSRRGRSSSSPSPGRSPSTPRYWSSTRPRPASTARASG